jgi:hypothetical protein
MKPESAVQSRDRAFSFLRVNERPSKPRSHGVTEIPRPLLHGDGQAVSRRREG